MIYSWWIFNWKLSMSINKKLFLIRTIKHFKNSSNYLTFCPWLPFSAFFFSARRLGNLFPKATFYQRCAICGSVFNSSICSPSVSSSLSFCHTIILFTILTITILTILTITTLTMMILKRMLQVDNSSTGHSTDWSEVNQHNLCFTINGRASFLWLSCFCATRWACFIWIWFK